MILRRLKTLLLAVLVVVSLVLSYWLWRGIWQNRSEVVITEPAALPSTQYPQFTDVTRPYQIVGRDASGSVVHVPDSPTYAKWMSRISTLQIYGLHAVNAVEDLDVRESVEYDFGLTVDRATLSKFMPGLKSAFNSVWVNKVVLYASNVTHSVRIVLSYDNQTYLADTDLDYARFMEWLSPVPNEPVWRTFNTATHSYVPLQGYTMTESEWELSGPQVVPLVHSFFVNPLALTSVRENEHMVFWTDGSRIVWTDNAANRMTYQDPNSSAAGLQGRFPMALAAMFIRNHGGSPKSVIAFASDGQDVTDVLQSYVLHPYVDGFPIVDGSMDYAVQLQQGYVVQYRRPLQELSRRLWSKKVKIIDAPSLFRIVHKLMPSTPADNIDAQLGYITVPVRPNTVILQPVYNVTESDIPVFTINAVTGHVMKGVSLQ